MNFLVLTQQKATSVSKCSKFGNQLLLAKAHYLEVYDISNNGIELRKQIDLYDNIESISHGLVITTRSVLDFEKGLISVFTLQQKSIVFACESKILVICNQNKCQILRRKTHIPEPSIIQPGSVKSAIFVNEIPYILCENQIYKLGEKKPIFSFVNSDQKILIPGVNSLYALSDQSISLIMLDNNSIVSIDMSIKFACLTFFEGKNILGDAFGNLYLLYYNKEIKFVNIGQTSIASSISHLVDDFFFLGSHFGDSQLIRLTNKVEIVENFFNCAPMTDFVIVNENEQNKIISCSGAFKDGSLRDIALGARIKKIAEIDINNLEGIWVIEHKKCHAMILSFAFETKMLVLHGNEIIEQIPSNFIENERTIFASQISCWEWSQITTCRVRLHTQDNYIDWIAPKDNVITIGNACSNHIVVSLSKGAVVLLLKTENELSVIKEINTTHQISCLALNNKYLYLGSWSSTLHVFNLYDMTFLNAMNLSEHPPRSIACCKNYVVVGMGNGKVFAWQSNDGMLQNKRIFHVGTVPIRLSVLDADICFVSSDFPGIINFNDPISYCNVDFKNITHASQFSSPIIANGIVLCAQDSLIIGELKKEQGLHIQKVPLWEHSRRISYCSVKSIYGILSVKSSCLGEIGYFKIFDRYLKLMDSFVFEEYECVQALEYGNFSECPNCFVVGTAYAFPGEDDPRKGRILVFGVQNSKIKLITNVTVKGAVLAIAFFQGKLVVGINSKVVLFELKNTLNVLSTFHGLVLVISLCVRDNYILAGDLLKSIIVLSYTDKLREINRDFDSKWITASIILDGPYFVEASKEGCIFIMESASKLETIAKISIGETINRFRLGSVISPNNIQKEIIPVVTYCTVNGTIGIIAKLDDSLYGPLYKLQQNLSLFVADGEAQIQFRQVSLQGKTEDSSGFIDGDFIQKYLELSEQDQILAAGGQENVEKLKMIVLKTQSLLK
jgi:DNA damage-binding protein 1